jgi:hypothetical protein
MIHALDSMRNLVEKVRRAICFKLPVAQYEDDLDAMCALLDDGDILNAAEAALAPDLEPATCLVDTSEQLPFTPFLWQQNKQVHLPVERFNLQEGDYGSTITLALDNGTKRPAVLFERKSIQDLYSTLYSSSDDALGEVRANEARFREELLRMREVVKAGGRAYIVVEGEGADLVEYIIERKRRVDPTGAVHHIEAMAFDYEIPIRWNSMWKRWKDDRGRWQHEYHHRHARYRAEWFVGYLLSRAHLQATSKTEAKKAAKRGLVLPWACDITKAVKKAADAIREELQ